MTERLSDVVARIGSVRQLSSVIGAMRGIAAARAREARERVEGVRAYAATVGAAIGQALSLAEDGGALSGPSARDGHLVIALCAEQGFAGAFNRRVLDAAERLLKADGSTGREVLLLGGRGRVAAEERGLKLGWSAAMAAHLDEVAALADRVTEQLYDRLGSGVVTRVSLVHAAPALGEIHVVVRPLAPFDFARFPRAPGRVAAHHHAAAADPADRACGGIRVRRALRGADAVAGRGKRSAHARHDGSEVQRDEDARRAPRPLPPAPAGRDHQRDHRAWRSKEGAQRSVMSRLGHYSFWPAGAGSSCVRRRTIWSSLAVSTWRPASALEGRVRPFADIPVRGKNNEFRTSREK